MDLRRRRCGETDENHDAIATRVAGKVDINIRFPVVDGPDVASLIDDHGRLTHHWDETGRSALTVQRLSIVQQHFATCRRHRVACGRGYRIAYVVTRGGVDSPKLGEPACERGGGKAETAEICDPNVVFTIDDRVPRTVQ